MSLWAISSGEKNIFLATDFTSLQELEAEVLANTCEGDEKVKIEFPGEEEPDVEKEPTKVEVV